MLPNTTAAINDGSADHFYDLRIVGNNKSVRVESAAPVDQPANVTISHATTGSGLKTTRRSVVRFDRVVEDALGNQGTMSAYLVVSTPEKVVPAGQAGKTVAELLAFLGTSTYKSQFLNGEI